MQRIVFLSAFLLAACASEVRTADDGTHFITGEGPGYPLAHSQFTQKANEICPNGYEVLNESTSWGWVITASGRVRCR